MLTAELFKKLRKEVAEVGNTQARLHLRTSRAETCGGVPACLLIDAPLAATGGLSDGTSYIDMLWISNGRKAGEGAGAGTGVLAIYQASTDQWLRLTDYTVVIT